jgi:V/A-type H+-transporting ATPase subunit K
MDFLGWLGSACVFGIAAIGSAIGIGAAGQAAIGAWKRCYMNNKAAPFVLLVFSGAPLTQTLYGYLLMGSLQDKLAAGMNPGMILGVGIFSGLAMAASAVFQGKAGAAASDAFGETGKGFVNFIMVVGLCETVALFTMAFNL